MDKNGISLTKRSIERCKDTQNIENENVFTQKLFHKEINDKHS